jgi:DNA polymerase III epsilon subunit-like protein
LDELLILFPNFYDIKVIADTSLGMYRGSLAALCERLGVVRDDKCEHQAGSDSKITSKCFIELQKMSTKSCNVVLGAHGEIFGLSRLKKSPIPAGGKEAPPRILAGTNVKAGTNQLSAQPAFEPSSQDQLFESKTNSISPPHHYMFRNSYDL